MKKCKKISWISFIRLKFLSILILSIIYLGPSFALDEFKYPDKELPRDLCTKIYDKLNNPLFNYSRKTPILVEVDLLIEDIHQINSKELDFQTSFSLWVDWKDDRLINVLNELGFFTSEGKPQYLCDYPPNTIIGKDRKIFDPVVEFFNLKEKPNFEYGMHDWVEIFSDGTIQTRLRDTRTFKGNFDFKRFPFDTQTLYFEILTEFPVSIVKINPSEPIMSEYKKNLYSFGEEDGGIKIPGWKLKNVNYESYIYEESDGYSYSGFILDLEVERISYFYLFKIILPIIFLLAISWSVFWVRGSQLEAKVNITIVCLLSLIAYNFIIDEDLPKLSYLTFLDSFILVSYFYTGIATILCVYSFLKKIKSGKDISVIDLKSRWLGPLSYFVILISTMVYFLY